MPDDENGSRWISFHNVVSLGNLLIIVSMLASGIITLFVVGRQVQGVLDDVERLHMEIVQETNMRLQSEKAIDAQIAGIVLQENRDMEAINATLQDMRADYRTLLSLAQPTPTERRR
jgi:uncharacterized membrane protein